MFKNDLAVHSSVLAMFREVLLYEPLKEISGFLPSVAFQPITTAFLSHTTSNGGNAMGLKEADGPLTCEFPQINPPWILDFDHWLTSTKYST